MITGDTGSAKSVYINAEIAAWDRYPNSQVFVFDNGYSGQILCEAVGGEHYDLASGTSEKVSFQPFRNLSLSNKEEQIGRASCRERVNIEREEVGLRKKPE